MARVSKWVERAPMANGEGKHVLWNNWIRRAVHRQTMHPNQDIVKSGSWLYNGSVPVEVRITRSDTFFGSGDYEDAPEIGDDRNVTTFAVWFESPTQRGTFSAGGGQFLSLEEAVTETEKTLRTMVAWR